MSVYSDLILSLNPVRYGRCDELSAGILTDSSTFAEHGTTHIGAVFGLQSAIETDSGSSAIGGPVGTFPAPVGGEADLPANYTYLYWIFYNASSPSGTAICRRGQWGLTHSIQSGINETSIVAEVTLENGGIGDWFPLSADAVLVDQTWYFVAVVRNGTVFRIYVNADLGQGNERTDLTTADVDYNVDSTPWFLGRSVNTSAFSSTRLDEVALFDYALSQAQITAVYEAALLAVFLNGQSNVIPTAILLSDFEPDPTEFPFRHNWAEVLTERISFRSAISQTVNGIEEGVSERIAPRRELEFTQVLRDHNERRRLRALLWANQHAKWFVPVRQYAEQLTAALSASAVTTVISTAYKDYEVGGWIGFRQLNDVGEIVHSEVRLISAVNAQSIEHDALVNSYSPYLSLAYPVRRALLLSSISVEGHSDSVEELTITARLLPEDEAIIPNRITPFSPTLKYRDIEVFDRQVWQSNDWSELREYEIERAQEMIDFDTGMISYESDTIGASESFSYRMTLKGIDVIAQFLGWYYERVGALRPVWVPTMQNDFDVLSVDTDTNSITVRDTNYSDAFALAEPRRDLAFVYHNGSMAQRRVIAFSGTTNETLQLDASIPSLVNLRSLSLLKLCRLDADQLELAWQTDNVVQVAWRFRELLHTPEGTGLSSLSPSASLSLSLSASGSASPSSSVSPSLSASLSTSPSSSVSPSASTSPSRSPSPSSSASPTPSASTSPSSSISPSGSISASTSPSASASPSS